MRPCAPAIPDPTGCRPHPGEPPRENAAREPSPPTDRNRRASTRTSLSAERTPQSSEKRRIRRHRTPARRRRSEPSSERRPNPSGLGRRRPHRAVAGDLAPPEERSPLGLPAPTGASSKRVTGMIESRVYQKTARRDNGFAAWTMVGKRRGPPAGRDTPLGRPCHMRIRPGSECLHRGDRTHAGPSGGPTSQNPHSRAHNRSCDPRRSAYGCPNPCRGHPARACRRRPAFASRAKGPRHKTAQQRSCSVRLIFVENKQDEVTSGWQRQAESSELGDGEWGCPRPSPRPYRP